MFVIFPGRRIFCNTYDMGDRCIKLLFKDDLTSFWVTVSA